MNDASLLNAPRRPSATRREAGARGILPPASRAVIPLLALAAFFLPAAPAPGDTPGSAGAWQRLEPGLEMGTFPAPVRAETGDSLIRVLRIDPALFDLRLFNASAPGQGEPLPAREWCRRNNLVAAINASMYQEDHRTSVSLMKTPGHVNNPSLSKDKAILAFGPKVDGVPRVKILDRECDDFDLWKGRYGTLVQSIRMLSCKGENVWSPQPRKWSTALIGTDGDGKVLFIHVRSPYATHDLIGFLRALPLGLSRAMYAEGGPEAQLYLRTSDREYEFVGSYESGFNENDRIRLAWPIPNVVGVVRREGAAPR